MITLGNLTNKDKGQWVKYTPSLGKIERGRIKGWNTVWVFVVYNCDDDWDNFMDYTGCATSPEDLTFILRPK